MGQLAESTQIKKDILVQVGYQSVYMDTSVLAAHFKAIFTPGNTVNDIITVIFLCITGASDLAQVQIAVVR